MPAGCVSSRSSNDRLLRRDFDVNLNTPSITFDDPKDYPALCVITKGPLSYYGYSNPRVDEILEMQDQESDLTRRKQLLREFQRIILDEYTWIPVTARQSVVGFMPWLKSYPPKLPFHFSPRYRWEQVWLER